MAHWYQHWSARPGLRVAGLVLVATSWMEGRALMHIVADPVAAHGPGALLLAALMFASASMGIALAVVGPGLWKPVRLSDRWQAADPPIGQPLAQGAAKKHGNKIC
jgi:hypothetical protein